MDLDVATVNCDGAEVEFTIGDPTEYLGQALTIQIPSEKCLS